MLLQAGGSSSGTQSGGGVFFFVDRQRMTGTISIDWQSLSCAVWNAQWGPFDDFKGFMWQFTDKLKIGGKQFDANILYD